MLTERILVVGLGRAGKTWIADGLAAAEDVEHVDEPDNHFLVPFALRAKRQLGQRFYPEPDSARASSDYEALWANSFGALEQPTASSKGDWAARVLLRGDGNRLARRLALPQRTAQSLSGDGKVPLRLRVAEALARPMKPSSGSSRIVVSSAYAQLAANWIAARFDARIVVVRRDFESLFATWLHQGWLKTGDPFREIDPQIVSSFAERAGIALPAAGAPVEERAAWLIGFLSWHLERTGEELAAAVVRYEDFVETPQESFAGLAETLGLGWSDAADRALGGSDRIEQRRAALHPRLADARLRTILRATLDRFALA
jgi:hypothetical protein